MKTYYQLTEEQQREATQREFDHLVNDFCNGNIRYHDEDLQGRLEKAMEVQVLELEPGLELDDYPEHPFDWQWTEAAKQLVGADLAKNAREIAEQKIYLAAHEKQFVPEPLEEDEREHYPLPEEDDDVLSKIAELAESICRNDS